MWVGGGREAGGRCYMATSSGLSRMFANRITRETTSPPDASAALNSPSRLPQRPFLPPPPLLPHPPPSRSTLLPPTGRRHQEIRPGPNNGVAAPSHRVAGGRDFKLPRAIATYSPGPLAIRAAREERTTQQSSRADASSCGEHRTASASTGPAPASPSSAPPSCASSRP